MPAKSKPKKSPKKKPAAKPSREVTRNKVARGILAGVSSKVIAADLGVTQRCVQKMAKEPRTQFLIKEVLGLYHADLKEMLPSVMRAVKESLIADTEDSANHRARMEAIDRHAALMKLAEGPKEEVISTGVNLIRADQFFLLTGRSIADAEKD